MVISINKIRRWLISRIINNVQLSRCLSRYYLKFYLAIFYENWTGQRMHYDRPLDFNQALIKQSWINSRDKRMRVMIPLCADKYAVREYIESRGYGYTLNQLFGAYDSVDDIDFESLPRSFIMKMNNASGRNYICYDKTTTNWIAVKKQFSEWLNDEDFGWQTGEWQYTLITPKIIIERFLEDIDNRTIIDYKAQVIHGKVVDFLVCYNRSFGDDTQNSVCLDSYSIPWNRTDNIIQSWHVNRKMIEAPESLDSMIQMAEECCKDFPYCRFDMYEINGKIVFGEMTFTPHGNVLDYYTREYLIRMKNELL